MKKLQFYYEMDVDFSNPVLQHSFTLKCIPKCNSSQIINITRKEIQPVTWISEGMDSFQNSYIYGKAEDYHNRFSVTVEGEAIVDRSKPMTVSLPHVDAMAYPTKLTTVSMEMKDFARKYEKRFVEDPLHFKENIYALMEEIYQCMFYVPGSTNVSTSAAEAFVQKKGVCQDYSHIMLAICRYLHIPCLYIAGFMVGEGASHAWVRVYDSAKKVWYEIDPTNCKWVDDNYIDVLQGKDATDCMINKGIYRGIAQETQKVIVIVKE